MKLLVDAQCWLWMLTAPERFSAETRAIIEAPENELFLSAASAWEIAIKHVLGKLRLPAEPEKIAPALMAETAVAPLPVHVNHALRVAGLPHHRHDPFDRLLVAQAQLEGMPILMADPQFASYDVELVRA